MFLKLLPNDIQQLCTKVLDHCSLSEYQRIVVQNVCHVRVRDSVQRKVHIVSSLQLGDWNRFEFDGLDTRPEKVLLRIGGDHAIVVHPT